MYMATLIYNETQYMHMRKHISKAPDIASKCSFCNRSANAMVYLQWQLKITITSCCMNCHMKVSKILRSMVKTIAGKIFSMLKLLLQVNCN